MLLDFELICHHFPKNDDITIIPVADVHLGAAQQMEEQFMDFLKMVKDTPNVYLVLAGDLLNNGIKQSVSSIYKERYMPSVAKHMMMELLEPVKDKILCGVCGNHERRTIKEVDDDPMYDIMFALGKSNLYRENMAFVKIQLGNKDKSVADGTRNPTYTLVVTHGAGGGLMTGASVNRAERFGYVLDGADCLIMGHCHKPFTTQPGKIYIDTRNNKVSIKPFKVVCATSWLDYGGYAAAAMMMPSTHCLNKITLCGNHKEMIVTM